MIDLTQFEGHTPGPWYVRDAELRRSVAPVVCTKHSPIPGAPEDEREVSRVLYYIGSEDREVRPNARLIAAAPDLLAEVKRLRALVESARSLAHRWECEAEDETKEAIHRYGFIDERSNCPVASSKMDCAFELRNAIGKVTSRVNP